MKKRRLLGTISVLWGLGIIAFGLQGAINFTGPLYLVAAIIAVGLLLLTSGIVVFQDTRLARPNKEYPAEELKK